MTAHDAAYDADVVVIGYGPVGATVAGLLARRDVRTLVVDASTEIYPLPRAAHVDGEAMRILQELGRADEMARTMIANTGMDFLTADHRVLLEMRGEQMSSHGWPPSQFINQPLLERQLRDAVEALGVEVRLGVAVSSVDDRGDHVAVGLADGSMLTARYVVGCDGARSTVRKQLGIDVDDLGFEEPWLVVDLQLDEDVPSLPTRCLQVCDPARPHTLVPMPSPRFRFEFMLLPGEDPDAMQDDGVVHRLLAPWIPDGAARIERRAVYTFHGLIAQRWRAGRVLLAGDAAHQMPPFLGQGMCSGLRDAANLAWKLAAVLQGAPDELLDTYQVEREPHVRAIVEAAVGFGRLICTTDRATAAGRDEMLLAAREQAGGAPAPESALPVPPYAGPLVGPGGGTPSRQPTVDGTRLDDLVGPAWLVVTRDEAGARSAERAWCRGPAWLHAMVLSCDRHPELSALLGDDPATAVAVVRPDRYTCRRSATDVGPPELLGT